VIRPYLFSIMIALLTSHAHSDEVADTQRFINDLIANPPAADLLNGVQLAQPISANNQQWVAQLARQQAAATQSKPTPQALYFVSFSIPEEGLKQLILEADTFGIPATLRGMVNNDMRETANAVLRLVNEDKRGGVQIDPKSFQTYGINAVPALVVTCNGRYDRIAGNLALREALTKVAESGDCADTAKTILALNKEQYQ
jgi:conjugal transfer pilus assembly protein TrbC